MTNLKQLDRLVLKIVRLKDAYSEYVVSSLTEQNVYLKRITCAKAEESVRSLRCGNRI